MQSEPLANPRFEHQQFDPLSNDWPRSSRSKRGLIGSIQKERAIPDGLPEKTFRVRVSRECNALDRLHSLNPRPTSPGTSGRLRLVAPIIFKNRGTHELQKGYESRHGIFPAAQR